MTRRQDGAGDDRCAQIVLKNPKNALATNSRICAATLRINADRALEAHRRVTEGEGRLSVGSPSTFSSKLVFGHGNCDRSENPSFSTQSANSGHWLTTCEGAKSTKANALEAYAPDDGPENGLSGSNRGGGEPLGGQLYPRRRTSDFKDKLSPNRFFEFGAVTPAPAPMSVGDEVFADPWARNQAPDPHVQATSQVVSEPKSPAI